MHILGLLKGYFMKIGIITLYHNSYNYGGILQAFALCRILQRNGVQPEQISYEHIINTSFKERIGRLFENGIFSAIKKIFAYLKKDKNISVNLQEQNIRKNAFYKFSQILISHSNEVYNQYSISECIDKYDVFITGSDQVWNYVGYDTAYFLDFVDGTKKKKFSYAASFSMKELTDEQKTIVANSLRDYTAISVREKDAVELLDGLTDKPVAYVVDPTLLLQQEEWDEVCAERVVEEKYVFGYFLGTNIDVVRIAKEFAYQRNFKFVMIPFASGRYNMNEDRLADIRIVDASPEKFLSLIRHAEYVFTDSFHAVVFSFIYKKQFFVFNRDKKGTMNSRIFNITELFGVKERFCDSKDKESLVYVEGLEDIDYMGSFEKFEELKAKSVEFLNGIVSNEKNS